jgi:TIR domain
VTDAKGRYQSRSPCKIIDGIGFTYEGSVKNPPSNPQPGVETADTNGPRHTGDENRAGETTAFRALNPSTVVTDAIAASSTPPIEAASGANQVIAKGLLDVIEITTASGVSRIELHGGDLTEMGPNEVVDALVVSAYPNDYSSVPNTLIAALEKKGISVAELARSKEVDLRSAFSCWLSVEIPPNISGIQFKRILCFEALYRWSSAPEAVGDIFRALAPFVYGSPRISTIAMPTVAAGAQGYTVQEVLPALLTSAVEWLSVGLSLHVIRIYIRRQSQTLEATRLFHAAKERLTQRHNAEIASRRPHYDAFISYAREDSDAAIAISAALENASLSAFLDQLDLDHGVAWQQHIFEALERSTKVIAVYSPAYVQSKVCQEEFNIAWARGRKLSASIIFPVYWETAALPTYMEMLNYVDCRERRSDKLRDACQELSASLTAH